MRCAAILISAALFAGGCAAHDGGTTAGDLGGGAAVTGSSSAGAPLPDAPSAGWPPADAAGDGSAPAGGSGNDSGDATTPGAVEEPAILWAGDFDGGNLAQWTGVDREASDRVAVVASGTAEGSHAARFTVKYGDLVNDGERAEVVYSPEGGDGAEGRERWYRWWTMWDRSYPSHPAWQLFTQWHHSGLEGSPPLELYVRGEEVLLNTRPCSSCDATTRVLAAALERGVWHEFVLHVKWSSNPRVGFVEVWYDGELVIPRGATATLFSRDITYLKQGLYREARTVPSNGVVYHDGMTISDAPLAPRFGAVADAG
jgi:hypothetical protein